MMQGIVDLKKDEVRSSVSKAEMLRMLEKKKIHAMNYGMGRINLGTSTGRIQNISSNIKEVPPGMYNAKFDGVSFFILDSLTIDVSKTRKHETLLIEHKPIP